MMIRNILNKVKFKEIFIEKNKKKIDLFYIENDFYYSIIYHPTEPWWEPDKNSPSHEHLCLSSGNLEESDLFLFLKTSLQAHRDKINIVQNREIGHNQDYEIINKLELKKN
jgi:hypothetical protein